MILHIFRKDARHLWPHVSVTLALLASLAWHDRWRGDWLPGSAEGWLNLLVPLAWACLIGLVMEQEPLTGDRQFWTTRPYRRGALLGAKVLFAAAFIHLPSFLADAYILAARGFSPLEYLPQLLWDQLLLAAALTLPAMALAALVRNFTHFILELVAVAALMIFLGGSFGMEQPAWQQVDGVRRGLTIIIACGAAAAVVLVQFASRKVTLSRSLGLAGGIAAGVLFAYLLPQSAYAVRSRITPVQAELGLRVEPRQPLPPNYANLERVNVAVPVAITGIPEGAKCRFESLQAEIVSPDGKRYRAATRYSYQRMEKVAFDAQLARRSYDEPGPTWLLLSFVRGVYDQLKGGRVSISGQVGFTFYQTGEAIWMPAIGSQTLAGIGRCHAAVSDALSMMESRLKVECESPANPVQGRIRLWHPQTGQEWKDRLGWFGRTTFPGPRSAWLSPLERRQTAYTLSESEERGFGATYKVPIAYLSTAKIEIIPEQTTGYAVLRYELRDLSLAGYVMPPRR